MVDRDSTIGGIIWMVIPKKKLLWNWKKLLKED